MSETNGDVKYLTETLEHVLNQLNYIVNRVDMYGDRSALDIETVKHLKDEIEICVDQADQVSMTIIDLENNETWRLNCVAETISEVVEKLDKIDTKFEDTPKINSAIKMLKNLNDNIS